VSVTIRFDCFASAGAAASSSNSAATASTAARPRRPLAFPIPDSGSWC
jgi:hypothetical protein